MRDPAHTWAFYVEARFCLGVAALGGIAILESVTDDRPAQTGTRRLAGQLSRPMPMATPRTRCGKLRTKPTGSWSRKQRFDSAVAGHQRKNDVQMDVVGPYRQAGRKPLAESWRASDPSLLLLRGRSPGVAQRFAIEDREDRGDHKQDRLVNWAGDRQQAQTGDPAQRLGDSPVAGQEPDRRDDPGDKRSHTASLGACLRPPPRVRLRRPA